MLVWRLSSAIMDMLTLNKEDSYNCVDMLDDGQMPIALAVLDTTAGRAQLVSHIVFAQTGAAPPYASRNNPHRIFA